MRNVGGVFLVLLFVFFSARNADAAASLGEITVEPIIGYETVQEIVPNAHTTTRLMYGVRATAGLPLISLEGEYDHGTDQESFPSLTVTDTDDRIKLGGRSQVNIGPLSIYLRVGVQATQDRLETLVGAVDTVVTSSVYYNPYAGGGLRFRLGHRLSVTGTFVAVFRSFPNMASNEYQATLGVAVHLP